VTQKEGNEMAKKQSTAIEKTSDELAAEENMAELAEFFDSVEVDGMDDVGGDDLKLASKIFNMSGINPATGNAYAKNVFYDTVTEETQDEINCVLLLTQKANRWAEYNEGTKSTDVKCSSDDRITGHMADGTARACKGCPDAQWRKDANGKSFKNCGPVHTVVGVERESQRPFLIRFKKTSLKPFRKHVMTHHFGARVANGKRANVPLFAYSCGLTLKMHEGGNYALPVLTRGDLLPKSDMINMANATKDYLDVVKDIMARADEQESAHASAEDRDPAMSASDFSDD